MKNNEPFNPVYLKLGLNYPAASSGVSIKDTIHFIAASGVALGPSFAINGLHIRRESSGNNVEAI
jgi:hypothetical protein